MCLSVRPVGARKTRPRCRGEGSRERGQKVWGACRKGKGGGERRARGGGVFLLLLFPLRVCVKKVGGALQSEEERVAAGVVCGVCVVSVRASCFVRRTSFWWGLQFSPLVLQKRGGAARVLGGPEFTLSRGYSHTKGSARQRTNDTTRFLDRGATTTTSTRIPSRFFGRGVTDAHSPPLLPFLPLFFEDSRNSRT